ncbi:MAG: hypothetical protein HYZ68_04495 [Chloroflexi bacterium]|nr:hypothetical protein [Chloroflexota bacterium]
MLAGTQEGVLRAVRGVDLHGRRYWDLAITLNSHPDQAFQARLGPESVYADLQPGDRVLVHFMLRMVMRVEGLEYESDEEEDPEDEEFDEDEEDEDEEDEDDEDEKEGDEHGEERESGEVEDEEDDEDDEEEEDDGGADDEEEIEEEDYIGEDGAGPDVWFKDKEFPRR